MLKINKLSNSNKYKRCLASSCNKILRLHKKILLTHMTTRRTTISKQSRESSRVRFIRYQLNKSKNNLYNYKEVSSSLTNKKTLTS